jgi:hypothetical protein
MAEGSAITVKIGAETDGIEQGLKGIQNSLKNLESNTKNSAAGVGQSFASMAGAVAVGQAAFEGFKAAASLGLSAVTNSISGLVGSFGSAISAAAQMETLETAFIPLLGSADAAQKRIADLSKFAAETPFELPEVAKASRTLETLTQGALATSEGLRLVGDVASGTNTPFEEMSTTIGRLYDGLQSGRPVGDVMQRLQELGAISGDTRSEIEALSASGKNVEAWAIAEEALGRFSGSMKLQSSTWGGLLSTFSDNVTQALAKFGEPIIDSLKPYLSATIVLVEGLAGKAAELGKQFSEKFIASSSAAKSFQTAIDAINIGETSKGFQLFWETTKLQVMQTGNSIINIFSAAFDTVSETIANVFRSDGPTLMLIKSAFDFVAGYVKEKVAGSLADTFAGMGPMFSGMAESLKQSAEAGATSAELALQRIPIAAELAAEDIGTNLAGSVDRFKENLSEANTEFFNTSEQAQKVADIEAEIATRVGATNAERANTTEQLEKEKEERAKISAKAAEDAEKEKANAVALIEYETAINEAKASGNEELVKSLESQKQKLDNEKEIAKLTAEYLPLVGNNAKEAERLATNFVNAKDAAAGVAVDKTTVTEAKKEAAEAATAAKSFATWLDYIQGVDPSAPVKSLKEQTADARREITAFGEYIGTDLKNKSFPDIARELGIKNLGDTGTEQMNQILAHIASKRGELTGIQPIDEQGGKNSLQNIQAEITKLGTTQQPLNLDASASIESIKSKLKENIDLAITTGEGSKILGEIKTFVSEIKTLVGTLSQKLPSPVLT